MRTKNSIINIVVAWAGQFFLIAFQFANRYAFARTLSSEYLGVSSLFTNILTMLSLTELGFGTALSYSLYVPLALNDTEKIKTLMRLYRNVYRAIGVVVICCGLALLPFYPNLIASQPDIGNLDFIFILYVLNTGLSYFFSYKTSLLSCDQKKYIHSLVHYGSVYLMNLFQIGILYLTHDFVLYLVCQVTFTFIQNLIVSILADRFYPYLKDKNTKPLASDDKNQIKKNVGAIFFHKMGDRLTNSGITIFVSKYISLSVTGIYANYKLITDSVAQIIAQAFSAATGSVGNLEATESPYRIYQTFLRIFYLNFILVSFCTICILCLVQPFIELWVGSEYLLNVDVVIAFVVNFYVTCMRRSVLTFRDASASYYYDRYKPVIELIMTFALAFLLIKKIGIIGVPLSSTITQIIVSTWVEAFVVHKHVFNTSLISYIKRYSLYICITTLGCVICFAISSKMNLIGFGGFIARLFAVVVLAIVFLLLSSCWMSEFKVWSSILKGYLKYFKRRLAVILNQHEGMV